LLIVFSIGNWFGKNPSRRDDFVSWHWHGADQVDGATSIIIGSTSIGRLTEDIDAFDISLPEQALKEIHQTLRQHPSPF